jgi:hypothetical protein
MIPFLEFFNNMRAYKTCPAGNNVFHDNTTMKISVKNFTIMIRITILIIVLNQILYYFSDKT